MVTTSTQPALGAIRLAWWREALERLDTAAAPAEPRLHAVAETLIPNGVSGAMLALIEDGYVAMLDDEIDPVRVAHGGQALFRAGARLLGQDDTRLAEAATLYAYASATRRGLMAIPADIDLAAIAAHRFSRRLRPLTALARLAVRDIRHSPDLEPEATPARAVSLVSHRLFGTIA